MTDQPPRPDPEAPKPDDAPHGVVESLREGIEDAVEAVVPPPVRWTVGKLVRLVALAFGALLVVAVVSVVAFLMNRTELVAREISLLLNRTLREHSDLVLDLRDLQGNPLTGFRAIAPRVRYRDGTPVLAAREMRVNYSAWSLITGRGGSLDVTFVAPTVQLMDPDGGWRIPEWRSTPKPRRGDPPSLQIRLHVREAQLLAPKPYGLVKGVDLDLTARTGRATQVRLERMSWERGPWDSRLERLTAEVVSDRDGVRGRIETLRTPDLELRGEVGWRTDRPEKRAHVEIVRVRWAWLAKVFDNGAFDVPGSGSFAVDALGDDRWIGRFRGNVDWDSLRAEGRGVARWDGRLLWVDSLALTSKAGDLRGSLRWSEEGWEIGGDARRANPLHWQALQLVGWPAGDLNGYFRYVVDTRVEDRPDARLEARLGSSMLQGWQVDSANVRVEFPFAAADSFLVAGSRRGGRFTIRGRTNPKGWTGSYAVRDLPLEEWPDGRATGLTGMLESAEGGIDARDGELDVTGTLVGRATDWASASFADWRLDDVSGQLLPKPDMQARLTATDGFFTGLHLDRVETPLRLGDATVAFDTLVVAAGDTTASLVGDASWDGPAWWMTLTHAQVASDQFSFLAQPPVRISGDGEGTTFERVVASDGPASLEVAGRWAAPGGSYDFTLEGSRLDLARLGMDPAMGLAGEADVRLRVRGRTGVPLWRFEGRVADPGMEGHVADSVAIVLEGGAHRLELEEGMFRLGAGVVRGSLVVERTRAAFPDSLSPTAIIRWLEDAGAWRGRATADAFPVDRLAGVVPDAAGWAGTVFGSLSLQGSPADPVVEVQAQGERLGWHDIRPENVTVRAGLDDGRLEVRDLRVRMLGVESRAQLSVPMVWALGHEPSFPDEPLRGRVDVPAGDLKVLPLIVQQLQYARGRFELAAEVSGTPRSPRLQGRGRIRDGVVRPMNRSEVVEGLNADLHFDEERITLDTLWARQGRTGRMSSRGAVLLDRGALRSYRFDVALRDFAAAEEGMYAMLFDGDFVVSDGPRVGGEPLPLVTGRVKLKRGVVEFDFANQSEVQKRAATTQPLFWTYRIKMDAKNNLRWRTADAELEFDADLDLQQTADSLIIYGEMHALRGTYWFLGNRFRLLRADLRFDNQLGVDPVLDIAAETRLPSVPGAPIETITAELVGRSSKPVITLTSSQNSDQRTILLALTVGSMRDEQDRLSVSSPLDNYVTRQLNAQLSANLSSVFRGAISEWELRRDRGGLLTGEGGIVVGVGSQVTSNLAFRYQQRLPMNERPISTGRMDPADLFEQNVEAEYRVNRFIYLTSGVARRRAGITGAAPLNTDYNVNLKARWEY